MPVRFATRRPVRFLLDTNILIAAEPTRIGAVEPGTPSAIELIGLANAHGHSLHAHPAAYRDLERNPNIQERDLLGLLVRKYPPLQSPPRIQAAVTAELGRQTEGSNEWVDQCMLAAVYGNAVNFLVTEDRRLRSKAARLGLGDQAMSVRGAIDLIQRYAPTQPTLPPLVEEVKAHSLDVTDPIFASLHADYPGFGGWFAMCQDEQRTGWIINNNELAAVTIIKDETPADFGLPGKTLKICLFKVSASHAGMRYGELLLKPVLGYAEDNEYETVYVTAFSKYEEIAVFFSNFGFRKVEYQSQLGESVFVKSLAPGAEATGLRPLDYHIAYGPPHYMHNAQPAFIVPIQPRFHDLLFPEANPQLMPERNPFGTGIRKAYLCNASIRRIADGSVLYFYRSQDWHSLTAVGIAEGIKVSSSADEIARYVGKRTVYSYPEIQEMADKGEVLAILFRQARILKTPIADRSLRRARVWERPSQSIMKLEHRAIEWIEGRTQ